MRTYMVERIVKVRRGFPLIATARIAPAEHDVGLMNDYIDELQLTTLVGGDADFLRLNADELRHVEDQIWESMR